MFERDEIQRKLDERVYSFQAKMWCVGIILSIAVIVTDALFF